MAREEAMGVHVHPANDCTSSLYQNAPITHLADDPKVAMAKNDPFYATSSSGD